MLWFQNGALRSFEKPSSRLAACSASPVLTALRGIGSSPLPRYFYFPTRPPTSYDSQDVYCSANEYFVLFSFSVWPLWLIYWKLILPPSAGRINRFLLGFTLLFPTTGPKRFRNINECAVTKPHFELHGFPRPQCTSSHVLGVVVLTLAPPDLATQLLSFAPFPTPWILLLPTRQDRHPVFYNPYPPTPLCLTFCPLLKSFGHLSPSKIKWHFGLLRT